MGIMSGIIRFCGDFIDLRHDVGGPAREISRVANGGSHGGPNSHIKLSKTAQNHMGNVTWTF